MPEYTSFLDPVFVPLEAYYPHLPHDATGQVIRSFAGQTGYPVTGITLGYTSTQTAGRELTVTTTDSPMLQAPNDRTRPLRSSANGACALASAGGADWLISLFWLAGSGAHRVAAESFSWCGAVARRGRR